MGGPWEKYAEAESGGPWEAYGKQADIQGNPDASTSDTERMKQEWMQKEGGTVERVKQNAKAWGKAAIPYVRPVVEGGLATLGGIAGAAGAGPVGAVAGGALGYAGGKNIMDTLSGDWAKTPTEAATRSLKDLGTGAMFEMGGQTTVPAVKGLASLSGKVAKPILGRLSGTGTAAIDEAIQSGMKPTNSMNPLKSTTTYDKALRGDIKGEEIVDAARNALSKVKDARSTAYQANLQTISSNQQPIDIRPIKDEVSGLMQKYNIKVDPKTAALDTSRIAMGKTGRNDIKEIIETISGWGTKQGDNSAIGLDTLKRQLDDFYSDSSQARQFVTQIRNKVKDTIVTAVPQYDEMTKGYQEATKVIKDVEAGLMLRKQGMTGRVVADQTLRRLTSSMQDNFALRKELIDVLGNQGGADLAEMIAGYSQNSVVPRGLAGSGPALIGSAALAKYFDPTFAAVIVASSPRVQGEFLRMLGKGMGTVKAIGPQAQKGIARQILIQSQGQSQQKETTP